MATRTADESILVQPLEINPELLERHDWRKALPAVAVVVVYFAIGLVAFWSGLTGISTRKFGFEGDFLEFVWFVGWVPHALVHGLNPFWSDALNAPVGVNLGQNTEAPFLGILTAPLSLLFSPLVAANFLLMVAMPISATAAFVVLRRWNVWLIASSLGGLMYGFSPYMIGQSQGHPQLTFLIFPPFIALVLVSIFQGRGNRKWLGIWLGLLVSAQYLVSPEVLATVALFSAIALICVAFRYWRNVQELLRNALVPLGIAVIIITVLLAYPVWMLAAGPQHVSGSTFPLTNPYHNDLLSFIVPGPLQRVSLGNQSLITRVLGYSDPTEAGGYVGIPVLLLSAFFAWKSRRSSRTQLAVVLAVVAAVLSLGPYLTVNGSTSQTPLPFLLIGRLPFLDDILPARFSYELMAFVAVVIAFGLDDMRRGYSKSLQHTSARRQAVRTRRAAISSVVVLALLVVTQLPRWPYPTPLVSSYPASLNRIIPSGNPVTITYPYDTASVTEPMFWQAINDYKFRILGGYVYIRDANGKGTILPGPMSPSGLQQFLAAQEGVAYLGPKIAVTPQLVSTTRETISKYHIRQVIVDRSKAGSQQVMELFNESLGPPTASSGPLTVWANWPGSPQK